MRSDLKFEPIRINGEDVMKKIYWTTKGFILIMLFFCFSRSGLADWYYCPCVVPWENVSTTYLFGNKKFGSVEEYKTCDP